MADESNQRTWQVDVTVVPKPGVNDPQGDAILGGLHQLGYDDVSRVRSGRFIQLTVIAVDQAAARAAAVTMCDRLLANPVIQQYEVTVHSPDTSDTSTSQEPA